MIKKSNADIELKIVQYVHPKVDLKAFVLGAIQSASSATVFVTKANRLPAVAEMVRRLAVPASFVFC
jgi:hypothetical protein